MRLGPTTKSVTIELRRGDETLCFQYENCMPKKFKGEITRLRKDGWTTYRKTITVSYPRRSYL